MILLWTRFRCQAAERAWEPNTRWTDVIHSDGVHLWCFCVIVARKIMNLQNSNIRHDGKAY